MTTITDVRTKALGRKDGHMISMRFGRPGAPNRIVVLLLCLVGGACSPEPESGSYVATLGEDTVAVEAFSWSDGEITGRSVKAFPRPSLRTYRISLDPSGEVQRVRMEAGAAGAGPTGTLDLRYTRDSVFVVARQDTVEVRFALAADGGRPLPMASDLFVFWELALGHVVDGSGPPRTIGVVTGRSVQPIDVRLVDERTLSFGYPEWGTARATRGDEGWLDTLDMGGTTTKFHVVRGPFRDVDETMAAWAARPDPGSLSPRDTARGEIRGATILVDYGRPAMRGRQVFGGIVPWNDVWRLGANAATQLTLDHEIVIGGTSVPAGVYSLWAIPTPTEWTLIVNAQHGQWGTQYDPGQDVARFPLTPSGSPGPVERFTISVESGLPGEGSIVFTWESTRVEMPFTVAQDASGGGKGTT
jgi:hypothetical protein